MRIDPRPKADGGNGGVRYDSYGCLGRVRIFEAGSGPDGFGYRYKLREKILVGRDDCGSGATITAVAEGDELDWRWKDGPAGATTDSLHLSQRARALSPFTGGRDPRAPGTSSTASNLTQWGPRGTKHSYFV